MEDWRPEGYWTELEYRVGRGVGLLDAVEPGWHNKIDIPHLRMPDGDSCICGQLFLDRVIPDVQYSGYGWAVDNLFRDGADYGFCAFRYADVDCRPDSRMWEDLAVLWIRTIEKRRAEEGTNA